MQLGAFSAQARFCSMKRADSLFTNVLSVLKAVEFEQYKTYFSHETRLSCISVRGSFRVECCGANGKLAWLAN